MAKELIHINDVRKLLNSHQPIDLLCWKKDGFIMDCKQVVCTSSDYKRNSIKIKFPNSGEIRTIKAVCIFEVNNKEVII